MVSLLHPPEGPPFPVPWSDLRAAFPWVEAMHRCPQDPVWHAEGDVGIHTEQVLQALVALPAFAALPAEGRWVVWLACLLHDVAKPAVTRTEDDGRITSRGHSRAGAIEARGLLWRACIPLAIREAVCNLVAHHQVPFFLVDRDDPRGHAIRLSQTLRCDWLALVAEADARGRQAVDQQRLIDNVALFEAQCEELGCLDRPWPFASDHARVLTARDPHRDPLAPALPLPTFTVTVMCGLPASGKDTWLAEHAADLPVVSLDALRTELRIAPDGNQGTVIQAAREAARRHLRAQRPFAWNATNLSRQRRRPILELCHDYGAAVRIVHLEAPPAVLAKRNADRRDPVPRKVIARMERQWEAPTPLEAHTVLHVET